MRKIALCVVGGLLTMLTLAAVPAAAQDESPFTISDEGECGTITIDADLPEPREGMQPPALVVKPEAGDPVVSTSGSITVGPFHTDDGSDILIQYRIFGGPERNDDVPSWDTAGHPDWVQFVEDHEAASGRDWGAADEGPFVTWLDVTVSSCQIVTPEAPTFTHPVCEDPGMATIPETEGVIYSILLNGEHVEGVTELQHGDQVKVTAEPDEGYVFPEVHIKEWQFVAIAKGCPGDPGEPGEDATPEPEPEETEEPIVPTSSETLPKTGGPSTLALIGLGMVLAGAAVLAPRLRRNRA